MKPTLSLLLLPFLLILALPFTAQAAQSKPLPVAQCVQHVPYGTPVISSKIEFTPICRTGYFSLLDNNARIPVWVAWRLLPENTIGCSNRSNNFDEDESTVYSSTPRDYTGSGYDQGHMANASHQSWNDNVELESFYMTNISPQSPSVNRGAWRLLELSSGAWAFQLNQPFTIIAGNTYSAKSTTIGRNKVVVPDMLWKVVINNSSKEYAAWKFDNTGSLGSDLTKLRIKLVDLRKITKVKIFLPKGAKELAVGAEWRPEFSKLTAAKRAKCTTK